MENIAEFLFASFQVKEDIREAGKVSNAKRLITVFFIFGAVLLTAYVIEQLFNVDADLSFFLDFLDKEKTIFDFPPIFSFVVFGALLYS